MIVHFRVGQPGDVVRAGQNQDAVHLQLFVVLLRLIQSQPQAGSASTKAIQRHPQATAGMLGQNGQQALARRIRDVHLSSNA